VRIAPALVAGLVGGAAAFVVALAGRLVQRGLVSDGSDNWRKLRVVQGTWWIAAGAVMVTAAVVAARWRRLPVALAMVAALVASLVAAAGILVGWAALGDHIGGTQIESLTRTVVGLSLFTGLVGALLGIGIRSLAHALRPAPAPTRPGPIGWVAVAIGAAVLVAAVGTGAALAAGTAPVAADYRDFALRDGGAIMSEVGRLRQEIAALPGGPAEQARSLRSSIAPQFRALHDRAAAALVLTGPVTDLRDRIQTDLAAVADGLEAYASAVERADVQGSRIAGTAVVEALQRLDGSAAELDQRLAASITS
jgi:hypothetical protein